MLLRTHTSPVQIRTMQTQKPPHLHHRAGPHLPLGQRRHPHADVPPGRGAGDRPRHHARPPQMDAGDLPQGLLRARRHRAAAAAELFPVHRAFGRGRRRLSHGERPARARRHRPLDGAARLRHGPPAGDRRLRARSRRMAGLRLRLRHRPAGDAQIRHGRPARLLRRRYALAAPLRLLARSTCRR